jgi:hypothetical protein
VYINTTSGIVKSCHHAVFDEAWYLQPSRPPAAQLLYDLGLEVENDFISLDGPLQPVPEGTIEPITVPWPPTPPATPTKKTWQPPSFSLYAPLPLQITADPQLIVAKAARKSAPRPSLSNRALTLLTVTDYLIGPHDMEMIYLSPDPYG